MLFTVPGLVDEEDDPIVEPDAVMADDGCAGRFVKAFMKDEVPWMDLRREVLDMMLLAVPGLDIDSDDILFEDLQIPYDGMESCWVEASQDSIPQQMGTQAEASLLAAPAEVVMISAPSPVALVEGPEHLPEVCAAESHGHIQQVEEVPIPEPDCAEIMDIQEITEEAQGCSCEQHPAHAEQVCDEITVISPAEVWTESFQTEAEATITENDPAVRFSFGPQEVPRGGWRVCFSF